MNVIKFIIRYFPKSVFLIYSNKKRQIYGVLVILVPLLILSTLFSSIYQSQQELFPTITSQNSLGDTDVPSFRIFGNKGDCINTSWNKFSPSLFNELVDEILSYVPNQLKKIISNDISLLWNTVLINRNFDSYTGIDIIGMEMDKINSFLSLLDLQVKFNDTNQGIYLGNSLSLNHLNLSAQIEVPDAPYSDIQSLKILDVIETIPESKTQSIKDLLSADLYDMLYKGTILMPMPSFTNFLLNFDRLCTKIEGFGQWDWKNDLSEDYNLDQLIQINNELLDQSGYLTTDVSFNVEYFDELGQFINEYEIMIVKFQISSLAYIIPFILILLLSIIISFNFIRGSLIHDIKKLQLLEGKFTLIQSSIIVERCFHIVFSVIFGILFISIFNLMNISINNIKRINLTSFSLSTLILSLFYIIHGIIIGTKTYKTSPFDKTNEIDLSLSLKEQGYLTTIPLVLLGISEFILYLSQITETGEIIKFLNILINLFWIIGIIFSFSLFLRLVKNIGTKKINFKNYIPIINRRKFSFKNSFSISLLVSLTVVILVFTLILPTIITIQTSSNLNYHVPSDAIIKDLSMDEGITSSSYINETLSSDFDYTFFYEMELKTEYPDTKVHMFSIMKNFEESVYDPTYLYNQDKKSIPHLEWTNRVNLLSSNSYFNQFELKLINTTQTSGSRNTDNIVNIDAQVVDEFDVFPMFGPFEENSEVRKETTYLVTPYEFAEFISQNVSASIISQSGGILFKGEPQAINPTIDRIMEKYSSATLVIREEVKDQYKHPFQSLIFDLLSSELWLVWILVITTILIYSIKLTPLETSSIRFFKMLKYERKPVFFQYIFDKLVTIIIDTIIGMILGILVLFFQFNILGINLIDNKLIRKNIVEVIPNILIFYLFSVILLTIGYIWNFNKIKLLHFEED